MNAAAERTQLDGGECRHCKRTIIWVTGRTGRRFAINPLPDLLGSVGIYRGPDGLLHAESEPTASDRRYREHDQTCTGARR